MVAGLHRAHHDLTSVDSNAVLDSRATLPSKVVATAAETVARHQGGVNRRCAKEFGA
jgi:hypothetical protein